jgi:hypothetical protein
MVNTIYYESFKAEGVADPSADNDAKKRVLIRQKFGLPARKIVSPPDK